MYIYIYIYINFLKTHILQNISLSLQKLRQLEADEVSVKKAKYFAKYMFLKIFCFIQHTIKWPSN